MTDIISILEDSSGNTTESSNKNNLHDKSSCTDLYVVHHVVRNRTNNQNNSFDENAMNSSKYSTDASTQNKMISDIANLVGFDGLSDSKLTK